MKHILIVMLLLTSCQVTANNGNAVKLCMAIELMTAISHKCHVNGYTKSIEVQLNTGKDAAKLHCKNTVKLARMFELYFNPGWKLKIYSWPNVDKKLTWCKLPVVSSIDWPKTSPLTLEENARYR